MAVLITASESTGINLANIVFESVRDCIVEISGDEALLNILEEAQYSYLLDLNKLNFGQRETFSIGLMRLGEQASGREGVIRIPVNSLYPCSSFM